DCGQVVERLASGKVDALYLPSRLPDPDRSRLDAGHSCGFPDVAEVALVQVVQVRVGVGRHATSPVRENPRRCVHGGGSGCSCDGCSTINFGDYSPCGSLASNYIPSTGNQFCPSGTTERVQLGGPNASRSERICCCRAGPGWKYSPLALSSANSRCRSNSMTGPPGSRARTSLGRMAMNRPARSHVVPILTRWPQRT